MKLKDIINTTLVSAAVLSLAACGGSKETAHDHDHDDPDHAEEPAGDDRDSEEDGHDHPDDDHDHATKEAGPNGGRLLTSIEPHAEFFVTSERKVQVSFLDVDNQPAPLAGQTVSIIAGDRSSPTTLTFAASATSFLSNEVLPEGDDYPIVVMLKQAADGNAVNEKFTMDFSDCPTCDYLEYACTCAH